MEFFFNYMVRFMKPKFRQMFVPDEVPRDWCCFIDSQNTCVWSLFLRMFLFATLYLKGQNRFLPLIVKENQ